jgi:SAM-dependent methyltransferase
LDVACGRGRHALVLAEHHYRVEAVDFALAAVRELVQTAQARGLDLHGLVADVTRWPLPRERYALVVVTSFLERALFPALRAAIVPGGALLYETFVRAHDGSPDPMRPEFLLEPGELEARCAGWRVLLSATDTVVHHGASARRAGILAQRPFAP